MGRSKEISESRRNFLLSRRDYIKQKYILRKKSVAQFEQTELTLRQCIYHLRGNNRQLADALQNQKQTTKIWSDECTRLQRVVQDMHEREVQERCHNSTAGGGHTGRLLEAVPLVDKALESGLDHVMALAQELTNIKKHFTSAVGGANGETSRRQTEGRSKSHQQYQERLRQRAQAAEEHQHFTIMEEEEEEEADELTELRDTPAVARDPGGSAEPRMAKRRATRSTVPRRSNKRSLCDLHLALDSDSDDDGQPFHTSPPTRLPQSTKVDRVSPRQSLDVTECLDLDHFAPPHTTDRQLHQVSNMVQAPARRFFKHSQAPPSPTEPPTKTLSLYDTQFLDVSRMPPVEAEEPGSSLDLQVSSDDGDPGDPQCASPATLQPLGEVPVHNANQKKRASASKRTRLSKASKSPTPPRLSVDNDENVTPSVRRSRRNAAPITLKEPSLIGKLRRT